MKALILASGIATRLQPLSDEIPKSLIPINNQTILGHQLEHLISCNLKDAIITTGPYEEKIKEYAERNFPELNIVYVHNPQYKTTNYIYTMWLTRDLIDRDILLMHGDMVFERKLLQRLLNDPHPNTVLVNTKKKISRRDFKTQIKKGRVVQIGVEIFGKDVYNSMPLYKFSQKSFLRWIKEIGKFIAQDNVRCYAEDAFNTIYDELELYPVYYEDELCMEIDDKDDLEKAKIYFKE